MNSVDQALERLLQTLTIDAAVVREAVDATAERDPSGAVLDGGVKFDMRVERSGEPFYPMAVRGFADGGLFLMKATNNRGKTTILLHASILLGVDWEDKVFHEFLEHEARYIEAGRRFQSELERGERSALLTIGWSTSLIRITVQNGRATVCCGAEAEATFDIAALGWRAYWDFLRPRVRGEFIPQKRDYLRQVYRQSAQELLRRFRAVEAYVSQRQGNINLAIEERELRDLRDEITDTEARLEGREQEIQDLRRKLKDLEAVETSANENPELREKAAQLARIRSYLDEMQALQTELKQLTDELDEQEDEYLRLQAQFEVASPAVTELSRAVETHLRANDVRSTTLARLLIEAQGRNSFAAWRKLATDVTAGTPAFYSRLVDAAGELDSPTRNLKTFPLRDEIFEREVFTLGEFADLLAEYKLWSRDVEGVLRPYIDKFLAETESVSPALDDMDQAEDDLRGLKRLIEAKIARREEVERVLPDRASSCAGEVGAKQTAQFSVVMNRAEMKAESLMRDLVDWLIGEDTVTQTLERCGVDPDLVWSNGFDESKATLVGAIEEADRERAELDQQARALDQAAEQRWASLTERAEYQYARASSIMDGVHGDIEAFLGSGFAGGDDFRTEYLRAVRDPDRFPGADDGIDLLTPLQEGLHAVVQERVGCYYAPDESGWKSLPIQSVNLASETAIIETDGTPSTVSLLSELGTGVRAAMTVRSLALPVPRPKYLSVLLVDEWGDVDQATLAQTLYRDLRQLPVPVLAIFTMPDAGQQPVLSDARQ